MSFLPFNTLDMYHHVVDNMNARKSPFPLGQRWARMFWVRKVNDTFEFRIWYGKPADHKQMTEADVQGVPCVATLTDTCFQAIPQGVIDYYQRTYNGYHPSERGVVYPFDRLLDSLAGVRLRAATYKGISRYCLSRGYVPILYIVSPDFRIVDDEFHGEEVVDTGLDEDLTRRIKAVVTPHRKAIQALLKMGAYSDNENKFDMPETMGLSRMERYVTDPDTLVRAAAAFTHNQWASAVDVKTAARRAISLPFWYRIHQAYLLKVENT